METGALDSRFRGNDEGRRGRSTPTCNSPVADRSARAEVIALADLDAGMPQDVVGGGDVEIEVRQPEMEQEVLALEGQGVGADRQRDLAGFAAVDLGRLEALH